MRVKGVLCAEKKGSQKPQKKKTIMTLTDKQKTAVHRTTERVMNATDTSRLRLQVLLDKIPLDSAEHTIISNAVTDLKTAADNLKIAFNRTKQ